MSCVALDPLESPSFWNLWETISAVGNKKTPIFVCVNSLKELDCLDSADLWDRTHIIPMHSQFVPETQVNTKQHRYPMDVNICHKIPELVQDFLKEYS